MLVHPGDPKRIVLGANRIDQVVVSNLRLCRIPFDLWLVREPYRLFLGMYLMHRLLFVFGDESGGLNRPNGHRNNSEDWWPPECPEERKKKSEKSALMAS
jgi:hypothetical protein